MMGTNTRLIVTTAVIALGLGMPAYAESHMSSDGSEKMKQSEEAKASGETGSVGTTSDQAADPLIVTVGEEDITEADVMAMIAAMPPRIRQQPQETLVPLAIEQLIMHELVLAAAMAEGLDEDEEVQAAAEESQRMGEKDAMVRIYLERRLDAAVTDEKVQSVYTEIQENAETEIPPLEAVRPQIEKQLRQEEYASLQGELQNETSIVFYGPDGEPRSASTDPVTQ